MPIIFVALAGVNLGERGMGNGVYAMPDPARRQVCLAHLARNFIAHPDRGGATGRHGARISRRCWTRSDRHAREQDRRLAWHDGELRPVHDELMDALEAGERSCTPELATLCSNVLDLWPAQWSFTEHADVESDQQPCGARDPPGRPMAQDEHRYPDPRRRPFRRAILTIRETCRCQNRPLHPYLIDVHNACLTGAPIPTPLTT